MRVVAVLLIFLIITVSIATFPRNLAPPDLSVLRANLTDIYGQTFSITDYKGKVVLLDFMASWCPQCKAETPYLVKVYQHYGRTIVMISISQWYQETDQTLTSFKNSFQGANWTFARDTANIWTNLRLITLPTLIILDKQSNIKFQQGADVGPITDDRLASVISSLS